MSIPVLALPSLDLTRRRSELVAPEGSTVAEIVALALPAIDEARLAMVRVLIDGLEVARQNWRRVRPKAGRLVVVRIVPAGGSLKSALSLVVTVAALAVGQFYVAPLLGSAFAGQLAGAALALAGNYLINALIPTKPPEQSKPSYDVTGWRNPNTPGAPVACLLGFHRIAPPFVAAPFTETSGDARFITAAVGLLGPVEISDIRIGDLKIGLIEASVEVEMRQGLPGDAPLALYPRQVLEDQVGVELVMDEDVPAENQPIRRTTAGDVSQISLDVHFPGGLFGTDKKGKNKSGTVRASLRYRLVGTEVWLDRPEVNITAKIERPFFRSVSWTPAVRGRYEVELTRLDNRDETGSDRMDWVCLRGHRPEHPLNFGLPLAMVAARVRASKLTNGTLDALNFMARSVCLDWDAASRAWISRPSNNPASLYRYALQGPMCAEPKADREIDLAGLQAWHEFCVAEGLAYNRLHDYDATWEEVLADICRAGRATPQMAGTLWSVCVDRPKSTVEAMIGPRNAFDLSGRIEYATPPDAFRVTFRDETGDYEERERIVRRPGLVGDPLRIETLELPGVTSPRQVWREATRRFLEIEHRPETWFAQQDFEQLLVMRGSLVRYAPFRSSVVGRVKSVEGQSILLDERVTMEAGISYGVRLRLRSGASVLRALKSRPGASELLVLADETPLSAGDPPDLAFVGEIGSESVAAIVKDVEQGEDLSARLTLIPAAPEIDARLAAMEVPPWDGRVGVEVVDTSAAPLPPRIWMVLSGIDAAESMADGYPPVDVFVQPGGRERIASYRVDHRAAGGGAWTSVTVSASDAFARLDYPRGASIEIMAVAIGANGLSSLPSEVTTHLVGGNDPAPLDPPNSIQVNVSGRTVTVSWRNPNDEDVAWSRLYRYANGASITTAVAVSPMIYIPKDTPVFSEANVPVGSWRYAVVVSDDSVFRLVGPVAAGNVAVVT